MAQHRRENLNQQFLVLLTGQIRPTIKIGGVPPFNSPPLRNPRVSQPLGVLNAVPFGMHINFSGGKSRMYVRTSLRSGRNRDHLVGVSDANSQWKEYRHLGGILSVAGVQRNNQRLAAKEATQSRDARQAVVAMEMDKVDVTSSDVAYSKAAKGGIRLSHPASFSSPPPK